MPTSLEGSLAPAWQHDVHFYRDEIEFAERVGGYIVDAVRADEVVVTIATQAHLRVLESTVMLEGYNIEDLTARRSWIALDAAETIERFFDGRRVGVAEFETVVGSLIGAVSASGRAVRAYGEMVALLWDAGHVNAAIELEALWNGLGRQLPFSLLCSYAASSHGDPLRAAALAEVCDQHVSVTGVQVHRRDAEVSDIVTQTFAGVPDAIRSARRFAVAAAEQHGYGSLHAEVALIAGELASNAVIHAQSDFAVVVSQRGGTLRIAACDASPLPPLPRQARPVDRSGRGLGLVAAMANDWGSELSADGKVVWAELQK